MNDGHAGPAEEPDRPWQSRVMPGWGGLRLFDIPIYRISPEQWEADYRGHFEPFLADYERMVGRELDADQISRCHIFAQEKVGPYAFNQIMGWVSVIWDGPGPVIKCYYVRVGVKRFTPRFKQGNWQRRGKIAELWFERSVTSAEIAAEVRQALVDQTGRGGYLRGRWLDLETFDALAPVIDWRTLLRL